MFNSPILDLDLRVGILICKFNANWGSNEEDYTRYWYIWDSLNGTLDKIGHGTMSTGSQKMKEQAWP